MSITTRGTSAPPIITFQNERLVYSGNPGFGERARRRRHGPSFRAIAQRQILQLPFYLAFLLAPRAAESIDKFQETQNHMGSKFTIVVYADSAENANRGLKSAFQRIHELDLVMSDYLDESEVSRLSRSSPTQTPLPISHELWPVLELAQQYSVATDGAFDITVGPLTTLWRRTRRAKQLPDPATLARARASVGYQAILLHMDQRTAELTRPGMRLDMGGIGQGYAADEALKILRSQGLTRVLVNASGDIVAAEPPPGERGWKITFPGLDANGQPKAEEIQIANQAISTSGDAFQAVEIDGIRYSHIVDPTTGLGVTESRSATVIADTCVLADAMATACCILDPQRALKLGERLNFATHIVRKTTQGMVLNRSENWPKETH